MPGDDLPALAPDADDRVHAAPTLTELAARVAELERTVEILQQQAVLRTAEQIAARRASDLASLASAAAAPAASAVPPPIARDRKAAVSFPGLQERRAIRAGQTSLEQRVGAQAFNLVGIVAIIVGTAWALKLAIEHGLIGPVARVVLGLAIGVAAVLWSERFRARGLAAFSYTLKAVGSGVLYLVLWAAMQIYHLLPAGAALAAMIFVTAWNAWMAWAQDAELLAGYALIGGLATPMLLSTGGDHETFLFVYLGAIDLATVLLVRSKSWQRLLMPAFLATVAYFIAWYAQWFHRGGSGTFDAQAVETTLIVVALTALFAALPLRGVNSPAAGRPGVLTEVLLPLGNAAFVALALYSVFEDSGLHSSLAFLMVALAAVYLGLARMQRSALATAVHLAAAVVLLTVAIPLQFSAHSLTAAWLAEGLVLHWVATRANDAEARPARRILHTLAAVGFVLGLLALLVHWWWPAGAQAGDYARNLATALLAAAALGGSAFLANSSRSRRAGLASLAGLAAVGMLLASRSLLTADNEAQWFGQDFQSALLGLAVLGGACWAAGWLGRDRQLVPASAAIGLSVLFNGIAVAVGVREIDRLFVPTAAQDADLARSLAISGFLMAYGALLLAAGFWRRSAPVRWQALLLVLITILKVFLYDTSGLSQGYRVVSFLALGALLLGVSFAYQKDWLGLRQSAPAAQVEEQL